MKSIRFLLVCVISATALFFGGCATASKSTDMVATVAATVTKHPESLSVSVTGGSETSSMGASQIANGNFSEAIKNSVMQSGLFAKIAAPGGTDYDLGVMIVRLQQPLFGASFTVTLEATWQLTHHGDQKVVWQKSITSSFTATMSDAFAGVTRLRLANEGAARENIKDAIAQMGALTLP
jgi:hypothetical protein